MEKLNAEQILKIISDNYTEEQFADGSWGEAKIEYSENVEKVKKDKEDAFEIYKAHPGYNDRTLRDKSYEQLYKDYCSIESHYIVQEKEALEFLGLGEVEQVDSYGGEGMGETYFVVWHFKNHDVFIRIDGHYESYNGVEFYSGYGKSVTPTQITRTEYI